MGKSGDKDEKGKLLRWIEVHGAFTALLIALLFILIRALLLFIWPEDQPVVIVIAQDFLVESIPTLVFIAISLLVFKKYQDAQQQHESSTHTSRIVTELQYLLQEEREKNAYELLAKIREDRKMVKSIIDSGLYAIHSEFPDDIFRESLRKAKHVRALVTWLSDPLLKTWDHIIEDGETTIEIILLKEDSEIAKLRSADILGHSGNDIASGGIKGTISHFRRIYNAHHLDGKKRNVSIKCYEKSLPSIYFIICDQTAFVGLFWHGERATKCPILEFRNINIHKRESIGHHLNKEFAKFERIATSVSLDIEY